MRTLAYLVQVVQAELLGVPPGTMDQPMRGSCVESHLRRDEGRRPNRGRMRVESVAYCLSSCPLDCSLRHVRSLGTSCESLQRFLVFCALLPCSVGCFSFPMLFSTARSWVASPAMLGGPAVDPRATTPTRDGPLL